MRSYLSLIPISAKTRRRQNRMTLLCIIFAVFLVTGIFSMADLFIRSETANARETGGNWHINLENISQEEAQSIVRRPDVSAAAWFDMANIDGDRGYTINGIQTMLGGAEEPFRTEIMTYFPEEASLDRGEVILTPNARTLLGVDVGDHVALDTPAGSRDLLITGFRSGNSRYATDSGVGETTALLVKGQQVGAFLHIDTFREILAANEDRGNPVYYVQFSPRANAKRLVSEIKEQLPKASINEHLILLAAMGASENPAAKNIYPLVTAFFLLVLLAGVLMISGSLNSSIAQRTQFFGMMRCIGMSKKQVIHFVELEALNWCKTAIPIGILLGIGATWLLMEIMHRFVGGEFARIATFGVSPVGMASGAVVGILTVLLAARAPAKKAAKVSPAAAVSGNAAAAEQKNHGADTSLMSIEIALGISHGTASKRNLFLMAGSFALSIILFLCFSVLVDLLGIILPTKSYSSDIDITPLESGELIDPGLPGLLRQMPGVKNVFGRQYAPAVPAEFSVEVDRNTVDILSYDDIQLDWILKDGDLRKGGDLKKVYKDQGHVLCIWDKDVPLTVGDQVTLGGSTVEIAGMMTNNPFSNNGRTDGDVILICSHETFGRLMGEAGYSIVCVQMAPNGTDEEAEAIHDLTRGRYQFLDRREEADQSTLFAFSLFLYGFLAIIALITALNIINSISMSVSARTRQYGAMRAVGMDGGQLTKMIAAEAATYALAGCAAGLGAGLPLSKLLYDKLITAHFPYFTWTLPVRSILMILVFVFAAILAAVHTPSRRMRNMAVTETINQL